jgi:hypothetical protein
MNIPSPYGYQGPVKDSPCGFRRIVLIRRRMILGWLVGLSIESQPSWTGHQIAFNFTLSKLTPGGNLWQMYHDH